MSLWLSSFGSKRNNHTFDFALFLYLYTMTVINPDKYIRQSYIAGLQASGLPVWEKKVPKDVTPTAKYYLISTQTKNETERSKCGYEWMCSIVIECVNIQALGYADSEPINDMEQFLLAFPQTLQVSGFDVKETFFIDSTPLDVDTPTNSIYRRVVTYQHWLNQLTTT